jgi:hypothetical protein
MAIKQFKIQCPGYRFDQELNLEDVSADIDKVLTDNFAGRDLVLRGIQSEKHALSKSELIELIIRTGSDRYAAAGEALQATDVTDRPIDLFGFACLVGGPLSLPILEGFHKWKPKSLELPQLRVDIWMVYDADQLTNVEYTHGHYGIIARDGYLFKDAAHSERALLGLIEID